MCDGEAEEDLAIEVVKAISEEKGVDILELDPIFDVIDMDTLEELFNDPDQEVELTFRYEGYTVEISGEREIILEE